MIHAVEMFASFFVPFYFFYAGLTLRTGDFTLGALLLGAGFTQVDATSDWSMDQAAAPGMIWAILPSLTMLTSTPSMKTSIMPQG